MVVALSAEWASGVPFHDLVDQLPHDPLVRHYLDHSMVMQLATITARGNASVTPLCFVRHGDHLIASHRHRRRPQHPRQPRVTLLLPQR